MTENIPRLSTFWQMDYANLISYECRYGSFVTRPISITRNSSCKSTARDYNQSIHGCEGWISWQNVDHNVTIKWSIPHYGSNTYGVTVEKKGKRQEVDKKASDGPIGFRLEELYVYATMGTDKNCDLLFEIGY